MPSIVKENGSKPKQKVTRNNLNQMAKRFTDTSKYKKLFYRSLPGSYKLFWDFLYHDCDHAGIWIVDMDICQCYLGKDMPVDKTEALRLFNASEVKIVELDNGKKWFIPSFIEFQYGRLSEKNRAHISVIAILKKYNLLNTELLIKPLTSPLQGHKDMDMDKELDKEKEEADEEEKLFPDKTLLDADLTKDDNDLTIVYVETTTRSKIDAAEVERMWKGFKIQHFNGENGYPTWSDILRHFRDWLKNQVLKNAARGAPSQFTNVKRPKDFATEIYEARNSQLR